MTVPGKTPNGFTFEDTAVAPEAREATPSSEQQLDLLVFHGGASSTYRLPTTGAIVIGRADVADIRIDDNAVSRQHARIAVVDGSVRIRDLGSHNGTYVNRERITADRQLEPGDTVAIHDAMLFLHRVVPVPTATLVLDAEAFQQRLEDELDRALRYERSFTVLVLQWPRPLADAAAIERTMQSQLRRIDAASWASPTRLHVLLAESTGTEAAAFVTRIRNHLDPEIRVGHATCPSDGADAAQLLASASSAAAEAELGEMVHTSSTHQTTTIGGVRVVIADPAVFRLYALIDRLAKVELPVLINGETGSGKELAATALHVRSKRRDKTLVSLNCAAIQDTLVESELFGHEKGAFSGAVSTKIGYIEVAHGSTLFLDEIGEISLPIQAKLLRVLENRRFTRVGDTREREVDVRIVAATNRDLEAEVEAGRFRQDLYFRLNGALLFVPPLRERPRELPLLALTFLNEACTKAGRDPMRIGEAAMAALLAHSWPGNIRELKNLMQYVAAAHPESELLPEHLQGRIVRTRPNRATKSDTTIWRPLAEEMRELEVARITAALAATGGNLTQAAQLISVPIRTFSEKVKQHGLAAKKRDKSSG